MPRGTLAIAATRAHDTAKTVAAHIGAYLAGLADAYTAASLYEELSRLSDAELARRGITRGDLNRCVFANLTRRR